MGRRKPKFCARRKQPRTRTIRTESGSKVVDRNDPHYWNTLLKREGLGVVDRPSGASGQV